MASQLKYDAFKLFYDEEQARYTSLGTRASLYFTIVSFLLGTILFKFDELSKFLGQFHINSRVFFWVAVVLVASLVCTLAGVVVRSYEGLAEPEDLLAEFDKGEPSDEDFRSSRIADLIVATKRSSAQNDRVANWLRAASVLTVVAIGIVMVALMLAGLHFTSS